MYVISKLVFDKYMRILDGLSQKVCNHSTSGDRLSCRTLIPQTTTFKKLTSEKSEETRPYLLRASLARGYLESNGAEITLDSTSFDFPVLHVKTPIEGIYTDREVEFKIKAKNLS